MKKNILFILLSSVLFSFCPVSTNANYAAGGELIYEWISGSTYRFYFKLYRDCGGVAEPATLPLCFGNSCNSTSFTVTMTKFGSPMPPYQFQCTQLQSKCDNPSAILPGYQEVWYSADATLPSQCNSWRMFTYLATRKATNNIANSSSTNMYIEAYLNNQNFQGNSSPYYSVKPFLNACQNIGYTFNNGAVDPNSDSLVNEVIQPLTGTSSCSGTGQAATFVSMSPPLSIPNNPFPTNFFGINTQTGHISFAPVQAGVSALAIRTKEYRNGMMVGSIMREMPVNIYSCSPAPAPTIIPASTLASDNKFYACAGKPATYCFDVKSINPAAVLLVSDSHSTALPGSAVIYQNQGTDSVRGCLTWTPPANASGDYFSSVTVKDSTCNAAGMVFSYVSSLPLYVWNTVNAGPDVAICPGTPFNLAVNFSNVGDMTWSVVSGDTNSLSCATCKTPTVTPLISTRYAVAINHLPPICTSQKDTIDFTMLPYNKPSNSITANPGSNIWPGLNVTFTTTSTNCDTPHYQWQINGNDVTEATGPVFNTTSLANNDIVTCRLTCKDSCLIDTPSNAIIMNVATGVQEAAANGARLYPNPNSGSFTVELPSVANISKLEIVNTLGQVVWSQQVTSSSAVKTYDIQTTTLPEGHYILKVGNDDKTDVLRFSVNR